MNNQIQPRGQYGQSIAPDHSNSNTSVGALQDPNSLARQGVHARRDQRLFYRDSNGHSQYISPDAFGAYDEYDEFYLICSRERFNDACAYWGRIGSDEFYHYYRAFAPYGRPDEIHVYPHYDFAP